MAFSNNSGYKRFVYYTQEVRCICWLAETVGPPPSQTSRTYPAAKWQLTVYS